MKKITLLLVMLMASVLVPAKQTVVYKGETATQTWNNNCIVDKEGFANASAGNVLYVKWELDTEYAASKGEDYYQLTVQYGDWSTKIVESYDAKRVQCFAHTLTSDDVTKIKSTGLAVSGRNIKVTDVEFSDAITRSEIEYWGTDSWTTAPTTNIVFPDKWGSAPLNHDGLKDCKVGDVIKIEFTPETLDADWGAQLRVCLNPGEGDWVDIIADFVAYKTSLSLIVDESNISSITTGDIRLSGNNVTITSVALETADACYHLSANNNVDITKLPTATPVNVELYRKFDWNSTICLPFDLADLSALPTGVKVYEFKEYNNGLVFVEREHIDAGVPYFMTRPYDEALNTDELKSATISFENVTINTTLNNSAESGGLTFKGNYAVGMDMSGKYGVAYSDGWGFFKGGTNSKLNAFSAYFEGSIPAAGARLGIVLEDKNTTGISTVNKVKGNSEYYNLNGQRIAQPTKGLYIVNGKKVLYK